MKPGQHIAVALINEEQQLLDYRKDKSEADLSSLDSTPAILCIPV